MKDSVTNEQKGLERRQWIFMITLNSNGQEFTKNTQFVNQNSNYFTNYDVQTVRIGFRYNFGNTKLQTNQRTKSSAEQERLKD